MGCRKQQCVRAACLCVFGFLGLNSANLNASVITSGCANAGVSCTLAELSAGADIEINDVTFDSWAIIYDRSNIQVSLADVDVVPLDDSASNPGLAFETIGGFSTSGSDLIDILFSFAVTTPSGAQQISGVSFELKNYSFGEANNGGFITGFEDVFDTASALIGDISVLADNLPTPVLDPFDSTAFGPTSSLSIEKLILLGGDADGDTVSLNGFEQRFTLTSVPEPITFVLFISGLLGLIWSRRTRRYSFEPLR